MFNDSEGFSTDYYNERAPEYDDIYLGKAQGALDPLLYQRDIQKISELCRHFGCGNMIDIGCGTGFWLSYYAQNCERILLCDASENMLAQCEIRVKELGLSSRCNFIKGDFFNYNFPESSFESCFVGFFISHLFLEQEQRFFTKVKKILKQNSQCMLIDSAWSEERKKCREKEGMQERILKNGRKFRIYKRYFDRSDIDEIITMYGFTYESLYMGEVFFAVVAHI
jgi:ubiquinone/menaquinone biosynthesis C-methylase UbiE